MRICASTHTNSQMERLIDQRTKEIRGGFNHFRCDVQLLYIRHFRESRIPKTAKIVGQGLMDAAHGNRHSIPAIDLAFEELVLARVIAAIPG